MTGPITHVGITALLFLAMIAPGLGQVRDRTTVPTGTGVIAGVVVTDGGDARPLRRAIVTVAGSGLPASLSAVTDDEGRFLVGGLPAGRYTVTAHRAAFLTSAYGARRPGRPGTPLILSDGQRADIVIDMARGAVIEGIVRDEYGQPVAGVEVQALDPRNPAQVGLRLVRSGETVVTDDEGRYRIYGLNPGRYVIATSLTPAGTGRIGRRQESEIDAILDAARRRRPGDANARPTRHTEPPDVGYPLTFYPGVSAFSQASPIDLAVGEERLGIDIPLVPIATSSVEGIVIRSDGQSPAAVSLSMYIDGPVAMRAGTVPVLVQPPDEDGRFKYAGLPAGRYTIYARSERQRPTPLPSGGSGPPAGPPPPPRPPQPVSSEARPDTLFAIAAFDVAGQDVSGLTLVLSPGVTLSGRIVVAAGSDATPAVVPNELVVAVSQSGAVYQSQAGGTTFGNATVAVSPVVPNADGTFAVRGIPPGRYQLRVNVLPAVANAWWLRSATLDGRDLLDEPLVVGETNMVDLVVTFTDRRTELTGTLQSATGLPAPEYFVVAFPADRSLWHPGSRRIRSTRPDTAGAFSMRDLPPGAYLLAALTDLEPADLEDERFLEEMATQAIAVTITDGGRTEQNLRIAR